mmetsp:Transcript_108700/g.313178  ORF Transcript_108700/g.313178 Transcript_108700/m.313178 type:complete len:212 (+) Transcript_108700:932-1567(+)
MLPGRRQPGRAQPPRHRNPADGARPDRRGGRLRRRAARVVFGAPVRVRCECGAIDSHRAHFQRHRSFGQYALGRGPRLRRASGLRAARRHGRAGALACCHLGGHDPEPLRHLGHGLLRVRGSGTLPRLHRGCQGAARQCRAQQREDPRFLLQRAEAAAPSETLAHRRLPWRDDRPRERRLRDDLRVCRGPGDGRVRAQGACLARAPGGAAP